MIIVFLLFSLIQERQFLVISESIYTLDHFVLVKVLSSFTLVGGVGKKRCTIFSNNQPSDDTLCITLTIWGGTDKQRSYSFKK